ncbi:MAG: flavin reductase family protein [Bryobacteraceae bacterium]
MSSDTLGGADFRRVCAKFATGVTVLTVRDREGVAHGMTVSSFTSVSLAPPLVLVCVDHRTRVLDFFHEGTAFAVNVLEEGQRELSQRFARPGEDRFQGVAWRDGKLGAPLLEGVLATIECEVTRRVAAGDHEILIGVVRIAGWREGRPLVFYGSEYRELR